VDRSKEKVAQRIVEYMDPNNKRNTRNKDIDIDKYIDWRNTLILNEKSILQVENDDDNSDPRIQAEKEEILQRVKFTPEKKRARIGIKICTVQAIKRGGEGKGCSGYS